MALDLLTWNVFHGRAAPPAGRQLLHDYATTIAGWEWDVALLQEVPPWWPPELAAAAGAEQRTALTSRNSLLPLRRIVAERWPDLIKSNGGGANAILVRGVIDEHRSARLRRWPERRVVHSVRSNGVWFANLHATAHSERRAGADIARAVRAAQGWAGEAPLVLGGDFNLSTLEIEGFVHAAACDVDHVFCRGLKPDGDAEQLDRGKLSDHVPLRVTLDGAV